MNVSDELAQLIAAGERAQAGYHHAEAVELFSQALELIERVDDPHLEYVVRAGRSRSSFSLADMKAALKDQRVMVDLAEQKLKDSSLLVSALIKRSMSSYVLGYMEGRESDLFHALDLASEIGDKGQQVDALLARFDRQPYTPPSFKESVAAVGEEVLGALIARGDLAQVSPDVLFLPKAYEEMVARIREHIGREGSISLAQTRDLLGTSRKYAQALLEYLDEIGMTKRVGDERILR